MLLAVVSGLGEQRDPLPILPWEVPKPGPGRNPLCIPSIPGTEPHLSS